MQGLHDAPPRRAARICAAPTRGSPPSRRSPTCVRSASPRSSCCRSTTSSTRASCPTRGSRNYWGYSSIGYLAPHSAYAATGSRGEQVREFKGMVKALHAAGIEVILDVVYNHTAEGNHLGPMLSFKGVDNAGYYRLIPEDPRHYMDFTGTGNTLNPRPPERAAPDHGLAALLRDRVPRRRLPLRPRGRARARALRRRPAVGLLRRHPPGPGPLAGQADRRAVGRRARRLPGRQLPGRSGRSGTASTATPIRDFWRGRGAARRVRVSASPAPPTSTPTTAATRSPRSTSSPRHDGFTLADLVSYNDKHNEANREDNRDGTDDNRSGTAAPRGRATTPRSSRCAPASSATC